MNGFLNRQFFFYRCRHRTLHNAQFECFNQSRSGGVVVAVTTPRARCLFTAFWSSVACFFPIYFYFLCLQTLPYFSPLVNCFSAQPFLLSFFLRACCGVGSFWIHLEVVYFSLSTARFQCQTHYLNTTQLRGLRSTSPSKTRDPVYVSLFLVNEQLGDVKAIKTNFET